MGPKFVSLVLCSFFTFSAATLRESIPHNAPSNLTLLEINNRQVLIQWDPISDHSIRGVFKGYLVRTWNHIGSQVYAFPPEVTKASVEFFPFSKNFISVSVRNEKYVGPPSEAISFDAPQIAPSQPLLLKIFPLSAKSVIIKWSKPAEPNGILLGYKIYCSEANETNHKLKMANYVSDIWKNQAKITGLVEGRKYRIGVSTVNCVGESEITTNEITMTHHISLEPSKPLLFYKLNYTTPNKDEICNNSSLTVMSKPRGDEKESEKEIDYYDYLISVEGKKTTTNAPLTKYILPESSQYKQNCFVDCMVMWIPNVNNVPGEHFYLKYKMKGDSEFTKTDTETINDFIILRKFNACKNVQIITVSVDGNSTAESDVVITPSVVF